MVQLNSTPCRKPRKSGGSPSGVSRPPMLDTRKMKKTMTWAWWRRLSLARMSGRMSSMEAPVVPMKLAMDVPSASNPVLRMGRPRNVPLMWMPPAQVKRAVSSRMKGMYSPTAACTSPCRAAPKPWMKANGTRNARAQPAATLP